MKPAGVAGEWIAVDWGSTHFRAWAMQGDIVRAEAQTLAGVDAAGAAGFEATLLAVVSGWHSDAPVPIVMCGAVDAHPDWNKAPYRKVPCGPLPEAPVEIITEDRLGSVHIVPGLSQAAPPDVLQGEETRIAGYLQGDPDFDGVMCLPGTHTKWVQISAGEVVSFRTFLTGEMYGLLSKHSILRHSLGNGWNGTAFETAVSDTLSRPESLGARLFGIRADDLLHGLSEGEAASRLHGLLIGAELAAARPYWLGRDVVVMGNAESTEPYFSALELQGVAPREADSGHAARTGLLAMAVALLDAER